MTTTDRWIAVKWAGDRCEYWTGDQWSTDDLKAEYYPTRRACEESAPLDEVVPGISILKVPVANLEV